MESALSALQAAVGPDCRGGTQARWAQGVHRRSKLVGKRGERKGRGGDDGNEVGEDPGQFIP